MPNRPKDKQGHYLTGSGVALAQVNPKTGAVISIQMLKSTGHKDLDEFALRQLRGWKFKVGTPSSRRVPITFTDAKPASKSEKPKYRYNFQQ